MRYEERSLNGAWELQDEILSYDEGSSRRLNDSTDGWIPTPVPGDIHQGLVAAGRIDEPLLGLNSLACHWTEDRSWWFRKRFEIESRWLEADVVELELDGLDSGAEIFVNGHHLGTHRSAFYPLTVDVKPWLVVGENVLLVRLTTGIESVSRLDVDATDGVLASTEVGHGRPERGDVRRTFVRKPQYSFGWDWSPRVATTAIAGDVKIRAMEAACIRHIRLCPAQRRDGGVSVSATVTVDQFHYYQTREGTLAVTLTDGHGRHFSAQQKALLRSGHTFVELTVSIDDPQLWWPQGLGAQHLYQVDARLTVDGEQMVYPAFASGIRFVELDTQEKFALVVNGNKIFCKGANWIPADAIYARVTSDRYDELVRKARDANFNMLRIWGGGRYEHDAFYQACDRYGIMVWHDFMFSCAPYPDHLEWFKREVEHEADYQTRRLQRHACIALWCGSNENNWGFRDWWQEKTHGGAWTYNYLLPGIVQRNAPEVPYWNGSPYGGDEPNSSQVGDRHHWHDCMMNPDMEKRITPEEYDKCDALFVSEFGYVGACSRETVLTYLDGAQADRQSQVWQHHTNTFECDTVDAGIAKHYTDPSALTLDEYLLYSGLCQGLMYTYALDSMRCRPNCHGSLFWMYNDCWGEVGWTIVDYYLRRKPAWYFVRRAFAPLRLIIRRDGQNLCVVCANDTPESHSFELEYGYVSLDGARVEVQTVKVHVSALERARLCTFGDGNWDARRGLWIARAVGRIDITPAIYRAVDFRQLETTDPILSVQVVSSDDKQCVLGVTADSYAHAVHLELPEGVYPSDDYFDLLPGEEREIVIPSPDTLDPTAIRVNCVNAPAR